MSDAAPHGSMGQPTRAVGAVASGWRAKKAASAAAMPPGFCTCSRSPGVRKLEGLDVSEPPEQEVAALAEDRDAVLPEDEQRRLGDAFGLLGAERQHHRRQLMAEERVGVGDGLVDRSRERPVEHGAVVRPQVPRIQLSIAPARSPAR